jgi:tRNA threonylcarbamoyladenosine biosynthesis protein TsaB
MATAKGIAFAAGCPLWAVSSLRALAYAAKGAAPVLAAVLDARRGEVYLGVFDGELEPLAPERALAPGAVAAAVNDPRAVVLGDALDVYPDLWPDLGLPVVSARRTPSGAHVALLALSGAREDVLTTGGPAYVRPAEAEVLYPDGVPGARRTR